MNLKKEVETGSAGSCKPEARKAQGPQRKPEMKPGNAGGKPCHSDVSTDIGIAWSGWHILLQREPKTQKP